MFNGEDAPLACSGRADAGDEEQASASQNKKVQEQTHPGLLGEKT